MTLWQWGLIGLGLIAVLATAAAVTLTLIKRSARRLAGHAPEVRVLCHALINDPRVLPHHKLLLRALIRYLELPLDLIPDFVPVIGRLDDALVVALAIRVALRSANADLIRQHWPGPDAPPNRILKRAKGRARTLPVSASTTV